MISRLILITSLSLASGLFGQEPNDSTAANANVTPVICNTASEHDTEIVALLDKIEKACLQLKSYQADMKYDIIQSLIDSQSVRTGKLYYKVDDNSILARIHFQDLTEIDLMDTESQTKPIIFDEDYYFDGLWVVRTNAQTKTVQKWEVAENRQDREAFRLGHGPFPLPFAIKTHDVREYFEVKLNDTPRRTSQENAVCLTLTPKPDTSYAKEYKLVELWVSQANYLPTQICYVKQDYEENTVIWSNIKIDSEIKDTIFAMPRTPAGWTEEVTPLDKNK
ncbi:MAG: hypothetical protein JW745_07210 [Sedimentisphaerales bacterium]|nr:hypothetical protein [Sedimentisphaerales bacterium]MBN2844049.1 hypothetical protein [Sedimentisphaerales bacterium]